MTQERLRRFSPSSLQSYRHCPLQFKYSYLLRLARQASTVEAVLGTCVHRALEELYLARLRGRLMTEAETILVYEHEWSRAFAQPVRFIAGGKPEEFHAVGLECLRGYYRDNAPFDADRTVGVERHVGFQLDVPEPSGLEPAMVHGYVDRLSIGRDGVFEIHDYKTSKSLPPVADKEADWQLAIYDSALRRQWPGLGEVRLVWHFLRHGQKIVVTRRPEQQEVLDEEVAKLILQIWRDQDAGLFAYREGPLCDWCDFRAECPAFKHVEAFQALPAEERGFEAGVKLVDAYAGLEAQKKELKSEIAKLEKGQEELAARILEYSAQHVVARLAGTEFEAEIHEKDDVRFPTRTAAAKKVAEMEAELKDTAIWPEVSRLDTRTLIDAFESGRFVGEAFARVKAWMDKWGHREKHSIVKLHKRRASDD